MPPTPILPLERLTRFATSKHHIRRSNNTITWNAFMPDKNRGTSVYRTSDMLDNNIWDMGDVNITKTILGRADIVASEVVEIGLEVAPDETPDRHANILGWADYDDRSRNKSFALDLEANVNENNNFYLRAE